VRIRGEKKCHHRLLRLTQIKSTEKKSVKIRGEKKWHHRLLRLTQIKSTEKKSVKICENPW
jgi:hypothetical protein